MATYFGNIDISKIQIGQEEQGKNGGTYRKVSYLGKQFEDVQLCSNVFTALRCTYGVEAASMEQPEKLCLKLEVDSNLCQFVQEIDDLVVKSVNDPNKKHISILKEGQGNPTIKVKLLPSTQVMVTNLRGDKITQPTEGSLNDIQRGSMIVPIVKIQGGVYFIEDRFGTSIVATSILVVNSTPSFNFGASIA
jgi:hypothetical protein